MNTSCARAFLAGLVVVAACGDGAGDRAKGEKGLVPPRVTRLARVPLAETEATYLARPTGMAIDPDDGSIYVADGFWGRVLRFDSAGALLRTYGSRGEGPGELKATGPVEVAGNTLLVADVGKNELSRFDRATGAYLGSSRYQGALTSIIPREDGGLWLGLMNRTRHTALASLGADGRQSYMGSLPREFVASQMLAGIYTGVEVAAWGDTVLAGFTGLNRLVLFRRDGITLRSLAVPVRARKGEMPDIARSLEKLDFPEAFAANSALFRVRRLASGNFALIHYDQTIDDNLIRATVYLTLLSRDFSRACPDLEIRVSGDGQPYTAFRGDELFVVQQQVNGERASAFVDRYRLDEASCFGAPERVASAAR
ncbi:MAG TPA: hypothetical protein VJT67_16410 [Longimicrobiaceae bacterium]|nr:hypothetical protein [Longimicrobiaceae bacterium]